MKNILFAILLLSALNTFAQRKKTINQQNFDELVSDLNKAQKGLNKAKGQLDYLESNCRLIAQQKTEKARKNENRPIDEDSVLAQVKKQMQGHYKIAVSRITKRQNSFDKINDKYNRVLKNDSIVPNKLYLQPLTQRGLYVSFNPLSIIEVQQGAVGLGIGYRISERVEIFTEASYLYTGFVTSGDNFKNLQGFRAVINGKYFFKTRRPFFIGVEFRFKKYKYDDEADFENVQTADTLFKKPFQLQNSLSGAAVFIGKKFRLSKNGKFEIEGLAGVGLKYRSLQFQALPVGYSKIDYQLQRHFQLYPSNYFYTQQWLPYLPAAIRFIYHF